MGIKEVYVVTAGEYSEYGIVAVFATKEVADKFAVQFRRDNPYRSLVCVETWPLLLTAPKRMPIYAVWVDQDGKEYNRESKIVWVGATEVEPEGAQLFNGWAYGCSHRSYDAALKAARDKLAKRKAREQGVTQL